MFLAFILGGAALGLSGALLTMALGGGLAPALAVYSGIGTLAALALASGGLRARRPM